MKKNSVPNDEVGRLESGARSLDSVDMRSIPRRRVEWEVDGNDAADAVMPLLFLVGLGRVEADNEAGLGDDLGGPLELNDNAAQNWADREGHGLDSFVIVLEGFDAIGAPRRGPVGLRSRGPSSFRRSLEESKKRGGGATILPLSGQAVDTVKKTELPPPLKI